MDALPEHARTPSRVDEREFTGSGVKFQNGDTLIARITPCLENGKTAFVSGLPEGVVAHGSTEYIVLAGRPDESDNLFAYYLARSPDFRQYAIGHMEGTSGRQRVPSVAVENFTVTLPPLPEQRAIAHILGTLDDKIELNRHMNETLEAIARAIFKSWFVDFDPVRAKASGEPPESICQRLGLTPDLLALFPERLIDSELGEIPEGWATASLYEMATYINGAAYSAFEPNEVQRGLPIIKIAELKAGVTLQTKYSDVDMPEKYRINRGDILFSWSGNPDTSIDTYVWTNGPAWLNQHIFRVVPPSELERPYVLAMLKYLRPVFAEVARNKQTTGLGHVTVSDLKRLNCVKPPNSLLVRWHDLIVPILDRIFLSEVETQTLESHRDALLPKLLSGELRVPVTGEV
jgi:type I restriction enzyme S subunit